MKQRKDVRKPVPRREYDEFRKACLWFQSVLNLNDWTVYFRFMPLHGNHAEIDSDVVSRVAVVRFNSVFDVVESDGRNVIEIAAHEMAHLLLADIAWIADGKYVDKEHLASTEHSIVRTLEKLLAKMYLMR